MVAMAAPADEGKNCITSFRPVGPVIEIAARQTDGPISVKVGALVERAEVHLQF